MINEIKRTGDLSLRYVIPQFNKNCKYFEIVQYYPNPHYKKEDNYIKEGNFYRLENTCCRIHEDCFKNKESCYTIGIFRNYEDEPIFESVGSRIAFTDASNQKNLFELINYFYSNKLWIENNEDE